MCRSKALRTFIYGPRLLEKAARKASRQAEEPQNVHPQGAKNRALVALPGFELPKLHNSNAHSLMQIALGHGHCIERKREYLNIFYDLIKHFY